MPVFNSERFLSAAIESVLCQTYEKWELLICDDRSVDGSWEIANTFADSDDRIFVFRNEYSKGASGARNTCIKRAKGQFLAFLDADDLWDDCKLAKQVAFVSETACCFTYCNYRLITEEDTCSVL